MFRAIERLENRMLLAAVYDSATGLLTINGTDAADTIEVELYFDPGGSASAHQIRTRVGATTQTFTGNPLRLPDNLIINAGPGNDSVRVFTSGQLDYNYVLRSTILGGDGDDHISLEFGIGTSLAGGAGNDTLLASDHASLIEGGDGNDELSGGWSQDTLNGGPGDDELYGGPEHDSLEGGEGNDLLRGQRGDDYLFGGSGADVIDGDWGLDTVYYNDYCHQDSVNVSIGDGPNDGMTGEYDDVTSDTEIVVGSEHPDTLIGDSGDNQLQGMGDNDIIIGNGGQDRLDGGWGNDTLHGGRGNDTLSGEVGYDSLFGDRGDDFLDGGRNRDAINGGAGNNLQVEGFFDAETTDNLQLTGTLMGAVVFEGSSWRLDLDGIQDFPGSMDDELELNFNNADYAKAQSLYGKRITVAGHIEMQKGVESGNYHRALVVKKFSAAK